MPEEFKSVINARVLNLEQNRGTMPEEFKSVINLSGFRYDAARYTKLLIRARWANQGEFLSKQELANWGLSNIGSDKLPAWASLAEAASVRFRLCLEFIDICPSGGIPVTDQETPEGRLISDLASLTPSEGGNPEDYSCLNQASESLREGREVNWNSLVDWSKLSSIRSDLDKLPHPTPSSQSHFPALLEAEAGTSNVFSYHSEKGMWKIAFGGDPHWMDDLLGFFYVWDLVNNPGKALTALQLRSRYSQWCPDASTPVRLRANQMNLDIHRSKYEIEETGDSLHSQADDLGDRLNREDRRRYSSLIKELPTQIESAMAKGERAKADELRSDLMAISKELRAASDLHGKPKKMSSQTNRARDSVSKAIDRALDVIAGPLPDLFDHFDLYLKYASICTYFPKNSTIWLT